MTEYTYKTDGSNTFSLSFLQHRKVIGILGILLPFLCWASCLSFPDKPDGWCGSLSATYYFSPILAMMLALVGVFLITYRGYDLRDEITNTISGVSALIVALFPCSASFTPDYVGVFGLNTIWSNRIHCIAAAILFISFVVNIIMNFTRGGDWARNWLYILIGLIMSIMMIIFGVTAIFADPMSTFWFETIELSLFGAAWLIKGRFLAKQV